MLAHNQSHKRSFLQLQRMGQEQSLRIVRNVIIL